MRTNNKTVLVTGSSRGIGKAIAIKFAIEGYDVIINGKDNISAFNETLAELKTINPSCSGFICDVSDYNQAAAMFEKIYQNDGSIDVLINNAAVSHIGLFNLMKPEEWRYIIDNNLYSVFNCCRLATEKMIAQHKGCIVNISSIWGNRGASCEAVYSASKGAVNSFTQALGNELAPSGIRVNAVACGVINTDMNRSLSGEEITALEDQIPLMRLGRPNEIADAVYFLCSGFSSYINSQIITVDGGFC